MNFYKTILISNVIVSLSQGTSDKHDYNDIMELKNNVPLKDSTNLLLHLINVTGYLHGLSFIVTKWKKYELVATLLYRRIPIFRVSISRKMSSLPHKKSPVYLK